MARFMDGISKHVKTKPGRILLVSLALAGLVYWGATTLLAEPPPPNYLLATVARGDINDSIGSLGTLEPKEYVDVGTQVSGQLKQLLVDIGDQVEQSQLLAEIDPALYESRVRSSRASLNNLRAQLTLQQAEQVLAERRRTRNRNLYREKAVSEDVLLASETEVTVSAARIEALKAQIDAAEGNLDGDIANLGYTKIYAPMAGTVVDASATQGQTINASQTAPTLVRIANLDTMTVRAQVSEADVVRIKEGMAVYFTTLGMPERRWNGTVRKVLHTPEILNNVVLYHVLIDADNHDRALMSSMTAQVFFVVAEATDALIVPASALHTSDSKQSRGQRGGAAHDKPTRSDQNEPPQARRQVQLMTPSGPEWREVEVGVASRTEVAVLAGLKEGDQIVVGKAVAGAGGNNSSQNILSGGSRGPRGR